MEACICVASCLSACGVGALLVPGVDPLTAREPACAGSTWMHATEDETVAQPRLCSQFGCRSLS